MKPVAIGLSAAIAAAFPASSGVVGSATIAVPPEPKSEPEAERSGLASLEIKIEAEREASPIARCGDFGKGSSPRLCLELLSPPTAALGSPVKLRLRWRNLSAGQRIRIRSISAAPLGTRYAYDGPRGAITAAVFGQTPSGDKLIQWDGKSVYCAPTDFPMMCDHAEVGRFRIEALLYTGDDPFWPSFPPMHPTPTRYLSRSDALEIELTGKPTATRLSSRDAIGLRRVLDEAIPGELAGNERLSWRMTVENSPVYESPTGYCSDYRVPEPLQGRISLCIPKSARDKFGVRVRPNNIIARTDLRMANGVMPAKEAKAIAERAAAAFLHGIVQFDHYPKGAEIEAFGPKPGYRLGRDREAGEAEQKRWGIRIVYLAQDQTTAGYIGGGQWLVSVDQVARDFAQEPRSDFVTYYYRIGANRRPCLIAKWNRTRDSGHPPRSKDAASLPCI